LTWKGEGQMKYLPKKGDLDKMFKDIDQVLDDRP